MTDNPFTFGGMITDPDRFIGRAAERAQIVARLNDSSRPQGSAVVGVRRIGKSSLLHYLAHPRPDEAETLRPKAGLAVIYLDAAAGACANPAHFRRTLLRRLLAEQSFDWRANQGRWLYEFEQRLADAADCPWSEATDALEKLKALEAHPVICLDEFESLLGGAFDDRFFNALRSWANEGLLSWVTASAQPLERLAGLHGHTSPFFNVLATVKLAGFTETECGQLLALADSTPCRFTPQEQRLIRRLAGNHPYHLQIAARRVWQRKAAGQPVSRKDVRRFLCQHPNPPPLCQPRRWRVTSHQLAWLLVILLAVALYLLVPAVQIWVAWGGQRLVALWDTLGQFGDGLGGLVAVVVIIGVILGGLWQRKRLADIGRDLWEKIS